MKGFVYCLLLAACTGNSFAASVDTVITYSKSMRKTIKAVVIRPEPYDAAHRYPVIYLLHGYGGSYSSWVQNAPVVKRCADNYNCMIVCPDGGNDSWYLDSPQDSTIRYETYVSSELVTWVDSAYATIAKASGRAITGMDMGGHGALYIGLNHQNVFGAAGSMSGCVDLRAFPASWNIAKILGNYADHAMQWQNHSVVFLTYLLQNKSYPIMFDCGTEDLLYPLNRRFHEKLLQNEIAHEYVSRPGTHTWAYWSNAATFQFLFLQHFFQKQGTDKP